MSKILKSKEVSLMAEYGSDKTPLKLGIIEVPCYVLNDGTRVLSRNGMQKALGYTGTSGDWLTSRLLGAKNISSNINQEIWAGLFDVIEFQRLGAGGSQTATYGYEATKLIDLCDALMTLNRAGVLTPKQVLYAERAEIIIRSVAKVGIIAMIDEATGYQYEREQDELQKHFSKYISAELLPWQKKFPDTFYMEIFRLNGWDYTVSNIRKRPGVVGTWTNKVVYEQLPSGILNELKRKTPKSISGNYTARLFQSLTADTGHPHLSAQLNQVIALMRISDTWKEFISIFNKMIDRKNGQLELKFSDLEPNVEKEPNVPELSSFNKSLNKALNFNPKKDE